MPQFNLTLFYFIVSTVVVHILVNYVLILKNSIIIMNFFQKRKIHLVNNISNSIFSLVLIILNVNNMNNKLFLIIIKLTKLNTLLNKIKNVMKIELFEVYDINKYFYLYNATNNIKKNENK